MKSVIALSLAFLCLSYLTTCTKDKIKDSCENNGMEISPKDYNQDSVIIFIPTAFSPEGDDLNESFRPFVFGLNINKFEVSKQKNVLYTESNIAENWNDRNGWDGTDEDGDLCKDGVYNYKIEGRNATDGKFNISGEVSLITEDKNKACECKYEDMIDPVHGFISPTQEQCNPE